MRSVAPASVNSRTFVNQNRSVQVGATLPQTSIAPSSFYSTLIPQVTPFPNSAGDVSAFLVSLPDSDQGKYEPAD